MPKPITYHANAIIHFAEDKADGISILKQGKIELTSIDLQTGEKIREAVEAGEFFGVKAALAGNIHDETARALTECTVLQFTVPEFEELISGNPRILMKMLRVFSNQLRRIHHQVQSSLSTEDTEINPEAGLISVGEYYKDEGLYSQAVFAFQRYLKHWPTGSYAPQAKLKADEAKALLEQSLNNPNSQKIVPKNVSPTGYSALSFHSIDSQYKLKQYKIALKGFLTLLENKTAAENEAYVELRIGCCLYFLEKYNDAIKQLSTTLYKYPNHTHTGEAICYIGFSYEALAQKEKALEFYQTAYKHLPKTHSLYRQILTKINALKGKEL